MGDYGVLGWDGMGWGDGYIPIFYLRLGQGGVGSDLNSNEMQNLKIMCGLVYLCGKWSK
jgi:hypothetical protein